MKRVNLQQFPNSTEGCKELGIAVRHGLVTQSAVAIVDGAQFLAFMVPGVATTEEATAVIVKHLMRLDGPLPEEPTA